MKYLVYILFISPLFIVSSCNKVMDTKPLDAYTASEIWGNYGLATGYVYNTYDSTLGYIYEWDYDGITKSVKSHPWGGYYVTEKCELIDRYTDEGWSNFGKIRAINLILQNVPSSNFTDPEKNTLLGEAYFLRAALYSNLAFRFGGVQIVKNVLTPNSDFNIPRSSLKETYDFVLSDLDSAAMLLPVTNERGRATQGAAYALKMRVALQAGAYINDNSYYTAVRAAGDKLFALNAYSLDDYSNMFNSYSTAVASPENILILDQKATNTYFYNTPMQYIMCNIDMDPTKLSAVAMQKYPLQGDIQGWMGVAPSQDLVDDYLVTDADGKEKTWDKTSYFTTGANVYQKMYTHRDKRFYASIVYDSCKLFKNWVYFRKDGNASSNILPIAGGVISGGGSQTGYLFSKYLYQDKRLWYSDPTDFCYSILRLGEAYLNYAEACLMLGDEATARTYITKTYQKHGGFANAITSSGENLWNDYKRERHVELILETGDRYWSLLRWNMQQFGGLKTNYQNAAPVIPELNGMAHGIAISADGKSYQIFEDPENNGLGLKFTPKRYLFPVPQGQITALPSLTQNAGW